MPKQGALAVVALFVVVAAAVLVLLGFASPLALFGF